MSAYLTLPSTSFAMKLDWNEAVTSISASYVLDTSSIIERSSEEKNRFNLALKALRLAPKSDESQAMASFPTSIQHCLGVNGTKWPIPRRMARKPQVLGT